MTEELIIGQAAPISDEAVDRLVTEAAYQQLAWDIRRTEAGPRPLETVRPRWRLRIAAGAALTAAAVTAGMIAWPGGVGPGQAQALSFTRNGQYVDVVVRDPTADPARLAKEFAAHGMTVDLRLEPASPSLVGTMLSADDSGGAPNTEPMTKVTEISGTDCGNMWCMRGVRIPIGLRGPVRIEFGRAPKPGERIKLTGDATAHGEVLDGVKLKGRTVSEILHILRQRHATVANYYLYASDDYLQTSGINAWNLDEHVLPADQVPGNWYVHDSFSGHTASTVELLVSASPQQ